MKNIGIMIAVAIFCAADAVMAQNVNWRGFNTEQSHLLSLNVGWDYGTTIGIGYGYKLKSDVPVMLNVEFSLPLGKVLLDDFKVKLGGQAELVHLGNFAATVKVNSIFRRYENSLARLLDFGSEFAGSVGYYGPTWFAAAECGFDKAITTQLKNSALMRQYYPEAKDGWYVPTGGNFSYGIQTGYSFVNYDLHLRIGQVVTQDFKTTPMVPYYLQLGMNTKL